MSLTKIATLYMFTYYYHSGQYSRGYRILSKCQHKLNKFRDPFKVCNLHMSHKLYKYLVNNYRNKI